MHKNTESIIPLIMSNYIGGNHRTRFLNVTATSDVNSKRMGYICELCESIKTANNYPILNTIASNSLWERELVSFC
jgi:hypothetical protein